MGARVLAMKSKLEAAYKREEHMLTAIPVVLAVTLPEVSTATIAEIVGAIHGFDKDYSQQPLFVDPIERARFWVREKRREDRGVTDNKSRLPPCIFGKPCGRRHAFKDGDEFHDFDCARLRKMLTTDCGHAFYAETGTEPRRERRPDYSIYTPIERGRRRLGTQIDDSLPLSSYVNPGRIVNDHSQRR